MFERLAQITELPLVPLGEEHLDSGLTTLLAASSIWERVESLSVSSEDLAGRRVDHVLGRSRYSTSASKIWLA